MYYIYSLIKFDVLICIIINKVRPLWIVYKNSLQRAICLLTIAVVTNFGVKISKIRLIMK